MSELRGYMLATTAAYLRQQTAQRQLPDPSTSFSEELREALSMVTPVSWCSVSSVAELNRLIAAILGEGEEERARSALTSCGRFLAGEATNTFMRLFMKVLTPSLFARKLPDLWRRDCKHGQLGLEVTDRSLTLRLSGMEHHDHIAAVMPGYVGFALETMGKKIETVSVEGWSLANPNSSTAKIDFVWKS